LKGEVTGRERVRLFFITNGFSRICGPSDLVGRLVMGGGAEGITGAGEETGTGT